MIESEALTGLMLDRVHPGELVRHDCIEPLGLTVTAAAKALGASRKTLYTLVNGRAGASGSATSSDHARLARGSQMTWERDLGIRAGLTAAKRFGRFAGIGQIVR